MCSRVPDVRPMLDIDLDRHMPQTEQRLAAREAWRLITAVALGQRAQRAVTPRPWVMPVVVGRVVLWLGLRLWHRRDPARQIGVAVPANSEGHHVDGLADLRWSGLTAMGAPLVTAASRGRLSPAAAVVSIARSIGRLLVPRRIR